MSSKFFILGLPRSRTSWLTAFLQHPDVFCGHEYFSTSVCGGVLYEVPHQYAGSVDTNPVLALEYKKDLGAPLVLIRRDPKDVLESLCKLFGEPERLYLTKCISEMSKALKEAEVYADLIIDFEDLDDRIEELWGVCLPTIPFDPVKYSLYKHLNINTTVVNKDTFKKECELWL